MFKKVLSNKKQKGDDKDQHEIDFTIRGKDKDPSDIFLKRTVTKEM